MPGILLSESDGVVMDIYDRSIWPSPDRNPLVRMLESGDEWFTNEQIVLALGLAQGRALMSKGTIFQKQIAEGDAAIVSRGWLTPGTKISRSNGGSLRVFNRRALVMAAMRTDTVNAAAFRDWMASRLTSELFPLGQREGPLMIG